MAPKLKSLEHNLQVRSGDSVVVACILAEGDPPFNFYWAKDGSQARSMIGVDISQSNMYTSLLYILEASAVHSGSYSCVASNTIGSTSTAMYLEVDGNILEMWF